MLAPKPVNTPEQLNDRPATNGHACNKWSHQQASCVGFPSDAILPVTRELVPAVSAIGERGSADGSGI